VPQECQVAQVSEAWVDDDGGVVGGDIEQGETASFRLKVAGAADTMQIKIWEGVAHISNVIYNGFITEIVGDWYVLDVQTDASYPTAGVPGSCVGKGFTLEGGCQCNNGLEYTLITHSAVVSQTDCKFVVTGYGYATPDFTVSCNSDCPLNPECTGAYYYLGEHEGSPAYRRSDGSFFLFSSASLYSISQSIPSGPNPVWYNSVLYSVTGIYDNAQAGAYGVPRVN